MKFKSIIIFLFSGIISVSFCFRENAFANQIENTKEKINITLKRALNTEEEINDPNVVFELAIEDYKSQFDDYINITALNVVDKENVNLPNFDSNYVAPKYYDVMFEYQKNLESSLTYEQNLKYIELQKRDYNFDRYVTLNNIKYTNLKPDLKYNHINIPVNPINPITPTNPIFPPDIGIMSLDNQQKNAAFLTGGVVTILANAGIGQNVIAAFTAAISTLTTAISTSWLLFLGWALAVALTVGALIALTVIIVENWDAICTVIDEIKNWFYEQFRAFSDLINTYFDDVVAQGEESTVSRREYIGDKDFEFVELKEAALADVCRKARRNLKIFLIPKKLKGDHLDIAIGFPVDEDWCTKHHVLLNGYSTYTWYQNTARRLILEAGTGFTSNKPEINLKNLNVPSGDKLPKFGFSHFHNYTAAGYRDNRKPQVFAHSFFGLLKRAPNEDGVAETHPDSPEN